MRSVPRWLGAGLSVALVGCSLGSTPVGTGSPTPAPPTQVSSPAPPQRSGTIDQQFTTPALDYRSTGTYLVWSSGARAPEEEDAAPDLFGAQPGATPSLLYDNPERHSRLEVVGGEGSRFAFMETNDQAFGLGGWKLWFIAAPGELPALIDHGAGGQLPFFALSGDHLVWTAVHDDPEKSELLIMDLTSMVTTVLLSSAPDVVQYWFPAIDGRHVVYGTVEPTPDFSSDQRHIYYLDLDDASAPPVRLDHSTSASEPAIRGDTVLWKESDPAMNFLNAGRFVRYSLQSENLTPLNFPIPVPQGGFTDPSIGTRFATAWPEFPWAIYVADLQTGEIKTIIDLGEPKVFPPDTVARPNVAGDLLAYVFGPAKGDLQLRWTYLP